MPPRDAPTPSSSDLDAILGIQLTVAWAGETIEGEKRLAWWRTELTDPDAGGDFLARLLPSTHAWAALVAVREAARIVDAAARKAAGNADSLTSLFHFGFALDERLDGRLSEHRQAGREPAAVFGTTSGMAERFDQAAFGAWLEAQAPQQTTEVVPGGRKLVGPPLSPVDAARRLARALAPLGKTYPLPFFHVVRP